MMLTNVRIENFKRLEKLNISLGPFDCLVGPNNSGKTTLLQSLALFDFCLEHCLSSKNGMFKLKARSIQPEEFYVLPVSSSVDLWTGCVTQARGKHKLIRIGVTFDHDEEVTATVDLSYNRYRLSIECRNQSQEWLEQLKAVRISYLPVFSMFLPQEERRTSAVIEDQLARGRVNTVIRNLLLNLKQENRENQLVETLQRVFHNLNDLGIEFDEANDRYISVTYMEQGFAKEFDIFSAGSGFQQFVYLFGFIHLREPTVVLLDEPDVHLHGSLQQALIEELRRLVKDGKQVLFATHSRDMITRMSPENILTLQEAGAKRLSVAFDVLDTLDRLGSLDNTQLPVVQEYRRVLVLEDRTDWDILSVFCSRVLKPHVWQQVQTRIAICYAKGNPCKQDMARLRKQLQQIIGTDGPPLKMFVVADRDYHPDLPSLLQSLPSQNIEWHVWERTEIENYLLSVEGIHRLFTESNHQLTFDHQALRAEFDRLVSSSRDQANDRLVKAFQEYGKTLGEQWDPATLSRKAREYLQKHWDAKNISLADAKEIVLPGIKRWLQEKNVGQFSDRTLAEVLQPDNLPKEIHDVGEKLARFAGVDSAHNR